MWCPIADAEGQPVNPVSGKGSTNAAYPNGTKSGDVPWSFTDSGTSTQICLDKLE